MITTICETITVTAIIVFAAAICVWAVVEVIIGYIDRKDYKFYRLRWQEAEKTIGELNDIVRSRDTSTTDAERAKRLANKKKELEERRVSGATQTEYVALYYGWEAQSRQCIEEMAEATKAINKLWRYEHGYLPQGTATAEDLKKHIVEELADTTICISQMMYLLENDFSDVWYLFNGIRSEKLDRAIRRIFEREESKQ